MEICTLEKWKKKAFGRKNTFSYHNLLKLETFTLFPFNQNEQICRVYMLGKLPNKRF